MTTLRTQPTPEGKPVRMDDEGYLVEPGEWSEPLAETLAQEERIGLSDAHWAVIRFMRRYYEEHHIAPDARHVMKHLAAYLGPDRADRNALFKLFPYGYVKQACRIAGMRRPRAWSTG
jgi:TusE/DsrC/DsvC family sulfur relay protein